MKHNIEKSNYIQIIKSKANCQPDPLHARSCCLEGKCCLLSYRGFSSSPGSMWSHGCPGRGHCGRSPSLSWKCLGCWRGLCWGPTGQPAEALRIISWAQWCRDLQYCYWPASWAWPPASSPTSNSSVNSGLVLPRCLFSAHRGIRKGGFRLWRGSVSIIRGMPTCIA